MLKANSSKRAKQFVEKLPAKIARQLIQKILQLEMTPFPQDSKKLKNASSLYRVDSGEYRIIYEVNNDTLHIALIGKRNDGDVYKKLQRIEN